MLTVKWYGHACFGLAFQGGPTVLCDPFSKKAGFYPVFEVPADVVTISHEHWDHNNAGMALGKPQVLRAIGGDGDWRDVDTEVGSIRFRTINTYHDDTQGKQRGKNGVFIIEGRGFKIAHLGDLGHPLAASASEQLVELDVLLVPTGGHYTIGPKIADQLVRELSPRVIIPMHYRTEIIVDWPLADVNEFTVLQDIVEKMGSNTLILRREELPDKPTTIVIDYRKS